MEILYTVHNGVIRTYKLMHTTPKGYRVFSDGYHNGRQIPSAGIGPSGNIYNDIEYTTFDSGEALTISLDYVEKLSNKLSEIKKINESLLKTQG